MTTMRVIVDDMLAPAGGPARYSQELTQALIAFAPPGCVVEGVVSASPESDYAEIGRRLPGLAQLYKSSLARRELVAAWQHGFTRLPGGGMIHAPSLLAPLSRHDRVNDTGQQIAVTIHDVAAWTHPESLTAKRVAWHKSMAKRAHKFADAVVVPTHAVADQLAGILDFGGRVQIIGGAVSPALRIPDDADDRAARLDLPPRYVLAMAGYESNDGIDQVFAALATPEAPMLPVVVVGGDEHSGQPLITASMESGLPEGRVSLLSGLDDDDLAVVIARAAVLVFASTSDGFGLPILQAFHLGTPVVHAATPTLVEVAADAGIAVPDQELGFPHRLADAIRRVLADDTFAAQLRTLGRDRAGLYSWRSSAERIWQLHADL